MNPAWVIILLFFAVQGCVVFLLIMPMPSNAVRGGGRFLAGQDLVKLTVPAQVLRRRVRHQHPPILPRSEGPLLLPTLRRALTARLHTPGEDRSV